MAGQEIGSASFGLVVGLGKFKQDLNKGEKVADQSGRKMGDNLTSGAAESIKRGGAQVAKAAAAVAAAAGVAIGAGMLEAMDREASGDRAAAALGLDPASAERAGDVAGRVFADAYGESFDEVARAVEAVMGTSSELRNASEADLADMTKAALNYARTFDADVTEAMRNVSVLLDSELATSGTEAFDLLIAGAQRVAPAMRDELSDAVHEYSQFAAGLGLSGEQLVGMFVSVADGGTYMVDKMGDVLKDFRIRATDDSQTTKDAFEAIGVSQTAMVAEIMAGGPRAASAFHQIITALQRVPDPAERARLAVDLMGAPFEDLSGDASKIDALLTAMTTSTLPNFQGATQALDTTLNDNFKTRFEATKRSMSEWFVELGDKGLAILDQMPGPISDIALGITALGGGAAGAAGDFGLLLVALKGAGGGKAGVMGALTSLGPYAAAAIAALAATYVIVQNWDKIKKWLSGFGDWISDLGSTMWDGIVAGLKAALNAVIKIWNGLDFKLPTVTFLGRSIGGQTIGMPDIPMLAKGGIARSAGAAIVGDGGAGELYMPRGASVTPLPAGGLDGNGHGRPIIVHTHVELDRREIARAVSSEFTDRERLSGRRPYGRSAA